MSQILITGNYYCAAREQPAKVEFYRLCAWGLYCGQVGAEILIRQLSLMFRRCRLSGMDGAAGIGEGARQCLPGVIVLTQARAQFVIRLRETAGCQVQLPAPLRCGNHTRNVRITGSPITLESLTKTPRGVAINSPQFRADSPKIPAGHPVNTGKSAITPLTRDRRRYDHKSPAIPPSSDHQARSERFRSNPSSPAPAS